MKTSSTISICLITVGLLSCDPAHAEIIDFEGLTGLGQKFPGTGSDPYSEGGYNVTHGPNDNLGQFNVAGSKALGHFDVGGAQIRIDKGGSVFTFLGLDLRQDVAGVANPTVKVYGFTGAVIDYSGVAVASETFTAPSGSFSTFLATVGNLAGVSNLTHLLIDLDTAISAQTFVDNVQVVPEPSSFAFLALIATGGMTVRRRRKRT